MTTILLPDGSVPPLSIRSKFQSDRRFSFRLSCLHEGISFRLGLNRIRKGACKRSYCVCMCMLGRKWAHEINIRGCITTFKFSRLSCPHWECFRYQMDNEWHNKAFLCFLISNGCVSGKTSFKLMRVSSVIPFKSKQRNLTNSARIIVDNALLK